MADQENTKISTDILVDNQLKISAYKLNKLFRQFENELNIFSTIAGKLMADMPKAMIKAMIKSSILGTSSGRINKVDPNYLRTLINVNTKLLSIKKQINDLVYPKMFDIFPEIIPFLNIIQPNIEEACNSCSQYVNTINTFNIDEQIIIAKTFEMNLGIITKINEVRDANTSIEQLVTLRFGENWQELAKIEEKKCFIMTATMNDENDPVVNFFRSFRDGILIQSKVGKSFVHWYYKHSPMFAQKIQKSRFARIASYLIIVIPSLVIAKVIMYFVRHKSMVRTVSVFVFVKRVGGTL